LEQGLSRQNHVEHPILAVQFTLVKYDAITLEPDNLSGNQAESRYNHTSRFLNRFQFEGQSGGSD
jgi:hypothetical protein